MVAIGIVDDLTHFPAVFAVLLGIVEDEQLAATGFRIRVDVFVFIVEVVERILPFVHAITPVFVKRAKLIETTARLGLLQTIDPDPTGFTKDLHTWNDAACAREQFAAIAGIKPEQALAELHTHLDSPDWPTYAVMILTARIEWFISPNDWDWSGDDNVSRRIPGYYLILQDLGYEPSDDETEHLDQLVAAITEEDEEEDE